jgi:hypothetical protein
MFSQALQSVQSQFGGNQAGPINESEVLNAHEQVYQGGGGGLSSGSIGTAAALQSLKTLVRGGPSAGIFPF